MKIYEELINNDYPVDFIHGDISRMTRKVNY